MIKDESGSRKFYGVYRGVVHDSRDPLKKRRIRLKVPQVLNDQITEWAWPMETASTKVTSPSVGQGVWVMFEGGDPSHPIWVGTFGKNVDKGNHVLINPVKSAPSPLVTSKFSDGTTELDLTASLVAMAKKINELETAIAALG